MSIKHEIQKEKQSMKSFEIAKQNARKRFVDEAKEIIPDFVTRFKRSAISSAARGKNIVKRGFFNRRTYVCEIVNASFFNPYQLRMINGAPEIDKEIISALTAEGFENISISRTDDYRHAIYISAWLDITE